MHDAWLGVEHYGFIIGAGVFMLVAPDGPSEAWTISCFAFKLLAIALKGEAYMK